MNNVGAGSGGMVLRWHQTSYLPSMLVLSESRVEFALLSYNRIMSSKIFFGKVAVEVALSSHFLIGQCFNYFSYEAVTSFKSCFGYKKNVA